MKAGELIRALQELIEEYGDLPVTYGPDGEGLTPFFIERYDEDGNLPKESGKPAYEFHIH